MKIIWNTKTFDALTINELYALLRLREQIFIIEQNSVYADIDNKDQKAIHLLGRLDNKIIAYARLFNVGDYFKTASIGRVVVHKKYRKHKIGKTLMEKSITEIKNRFSQNTITISAQCYLLNFYQNLGFQSVGESYIEDGIQHKQMVLKG